MRRISSKVGVWEFEDGRSSRARTILYLPHHDQSQRRPPIGQRPSSFDEWLQAFKEQATLLHRRAFEPRRTARRAGSWPTCCRCCRSSALRSASRPGWCSPSCAASRGRAGWRPCSRSAPAVLITRALHEDGLADTADGLGPHALEPTRRLEIMRDSRNGTFGVLALVLSVLVKVACLAPVLRRHRAGRADRRPRAVARGAGLSAARLCAGPCRRAGRAGRQADRQRRLADDRASARRWPSCCCSARASSWRSWRRSPPSPRPGSRRAGSPSASAATPATRWAPSSRRPRSPSWWWRRCSSLASLSSERTRDLGLTSLVSKRRHGDGAKITGAVTRWWWVRHAPVPNPEARCYGQIDKDCDVSNEALFKHQAKLLPKGAVWYASNLLRARKTAEHLGQRRRRDGRARDRSRSRRAAFRRLAGPHLCRDRREARQQPSVLARRRRNTGRRAARASSTCATARCAASTG